MPALTHYPPGISNSNQEASIAGSVAAAHYIRSVAPVYNIPVVLHTVCEDSVDASDIELNVIGSLREETSAVVRWNGKMTLAK